MAKDEKRVRFGQRLRELREESGMSRKHLADSMELSERAVIQWELGEREPGWFNVVALAQALGVEVGAFTVEASAVAAPARGRPRKAADEGKPTRGASGKRTERKK